MPAIHITESQAAALARGESITLDPPSTPLHNVVLFVKSTRQSVYIWDGELRADGRIVATRYQWLTDTYGDPENEDPRVVTPGSYLSRADRVNIVQVGA